MPAENSDSGWQMTGRVQDVADRRLVTIKKERNLRSQAQKELAQCRRVLSQVATDLGNLVPSCLAPLFELSHNGKERTALLQQRLKNAPSLHEKITAVQTQLSELARALDTHDPTSKSVSHSAAASTVESSALAASRQSLDLTLSWVEDLLKHLASSRDPSHPPTQAFPRLLQALQEARTCNSDAHCELALDALNLGREEMSMIDKRFCDLRAILQWLPKAENACHVLVQSTMDAVQQTESSLQDLQYMLRRICAVNTDRQTVLEECISSIVERAEDRAVAYRLRWWKDGAWLKTLFLFIWSIYTVFLMMPWVCPTTRPRMHPF